MYYYSKSIFIFVHFRFVSLLLLCFFYYLVEIFFHNFFFFYFEAKDVFLVEFTIWRCLVISSKYSFEDVSFKEKGKQFSFKQTNTLGLQFPKGSVSILSKQIPLFFHFIFWKFYFIIQQSVDGFVPAVLWLGKSFWKWKVLSGKEKVNQSNINNKNRTSKLEKKNTKETI